MTQSRARQGHRICTHATWRAVHAPAGAPRACIVWMEAQTRLCGGVGLTAILLRFVQEQSALLQHAKAALPRLACVPGVTLTPEPAHRAPRLPRHRSAATRASRLAPMLRESPRVQLCRGRACSLATACMHSSSPILGLLALALAPDLLELVQGVVIHECHLLAISADFRSPEIG